MKTRFCLAQSSIQKQLRLGLSYCLSLASVMAISAEAIAMPVPGAVTPNQAVPTQTAQSQTTPFEVAQATTPEASPTTPKTAALRLRPSYNLNVTEGAGHNGFASFGGFFPLFQTPGENTTFLEGRVSVDTDGDFGGGLQAGYRALLNDNTLWGAYAGLDVRDTGDRTFTQAGVGTELLGENWDLTLNANIPLGNARQVVDTDIQAANPQFTGNQLLIDEQRVDQVQAALTTVSLDAGLELFDFGGGSGLWGRSGVYYLAGEASEDTLGARASLDYRATKNLRFGAGVQHDGVFGTNAIFSVNASLGGRSRRAYDADENSTEQRDQLWARAAEPINRTNTILVENRIDVEILQEDVAAINPETGNAFVFRHVDPSVIGVVNGQLAEALIRGGTFEDPLSTIAQAANVADANADNIIFVQEGNAGGGFTLPDGVQVRSVGPVQQLNTQFGEVILPGSGSGNLPTVTGQVTIGNNTLVSGLEIDPTKFENGVEAVLAGQELDNGIEARGENITIEDNVIANVDTGINLPDIDGTVTIARNQISNTLDDGIFFDDIEGEDNAIVTITDNTLDAIGEAGIEFDFIEGNAIANITVANNQITDAQFDNIFFDDIQQDAVANITISGNVINAENVDPNEAGGDGIEIDRIEDNANATITINNNQISNVAFEGIEFDDIENNTVVTIAVENNQINSNETGIEFDLIENQANATISVIGNTITVAEEEGILFDDIEDETVTNITVANNNILGAATQGIEFDLIENNANATINVLNNKIETVGEDGILLGDILDTATAAITVTGNIITNAGGDGIKIREIDNVDSSVASIASLVVQGNPEEGNLEDDDDDDDVLDSLVVDSVVVDNSSGENTTASGPNITATVADNTITNPGGDGVQINQPDNANICLDLDNNTVTTPGSDGFEFTSIGEGQFQVLNLANVTTANVGTFNPADIAANAAFVNGTAGVAPCP